MALIETFDDYLIEPLGKHDRAAFSCGVETLDRYLKQQAGQDARKRVAAPLVLVEKSSGIIAGYYTLSSTSIKFEELPIELSKKLPKYPIVPATLLGRLAVDKNHRKKGLGEMLLMDALYRSLKSEIAAIAVVVDAKDDAARSFYEHYNFIRFPNFSHKLFIMLETVAKMFA
ncbi:GNAT family N-acetyltransferase [Nostocaceae cyanobacterium CENA357]|uniref:GNAT family N-acetyltransferase n=1 Tax=Atlanticothrix silvestris CENA357 TaxID=1725252 RepID=A0A8J7HL39_9CYAN|nr:GNAT family N-acetyltransferase [Atlanticothrix silvestris]MBH8554856.1 GNAT family N-acetyltransferase [Atlanticothrix silvestris CENA357]